MSAIDKLNKRDRVVIVYLMNHFLRLINEEIKTCESLAKTSALSFVISSKEEDKNQAKEWLAKVHKLEDLKRRLDYIEYDKLVEELEALK